MGDTLLTFGKFILAVLLIPIVLACGIAFEAHLSRYPSSYQDYFIWGVSAFILTFLFLHQFWGVYESGQKMIRSFFGFLAPLNNIFAILISVYLIFILGVCFSLRLGCPKKLWALLILFSLRDLVLRCTLC